MPVIACMENGKPGFKYGQSGKCYTYTAGDETGRNTAKRKAVMQGTAIAQNTGENVNIKMKMEKARFDDENNLIFGWGYVAIKKDGQQVIDFSKERVTEENMKDLELAVYGFNVGGRRSGFGHQGPARGYLVESMVFTKEKMIKMEITEDSLPQAVWLGFWFPNDEDYDFIKKMKSPMFSMEGSAIKEVI